MPIPTLETDRLIIREFIFADAEPRHQLVKEAFESDIDQAQNEQWLRWTILNYRELANLYQPPYGDYAIMDKSNSTLIGSVGLVQTIVPWGVFPEFQPASTPHYLVSPEFGLFWAVRNDYRGKGYAVEAAQALITFIFEKLNARRVVATTDHDNAASQRVMEKLGMRLLRNSEDAPFWFQVVGVLDNPGLPR